MSALLLAARELEEECGVAAVGLARRMRDDGSVRLKIVSSAVYH